MGSSRDYSTPGPHWGPPPGHSSHNHLCVALKHQAAGVPKPSTRGFLSPQGPVWSGPPPLTTHSVPSFSPCLLSAAHAGQDFPALFYLLCACLACPDPLSPPSFRPQLNGSATPLLSFPLLHAHLCGLVPSCDTWLVSFSPPDLPLLEGGDRGCPFPTVLRVGHSLSTPQCVFG